MMPCESGDSKRCRSCSWRHVAHAGCGDLVCSHTYESERGGDVAAETVLVIIAVGTAISSMVIIAQWRDYHRWRGLAYLTELYLFDWSMTAMGNLVDAEFFE
jgi:hypothetical protein